ncbi:LuxR C-terminal-related transcriptional regulator [Streptomyces sp. NPDC093600]|uniref:helix-turn-helix transcriptional regulator n=1 Tax=Streptomyces sp. NPDC093600 TaxID=3366047 RepID=UPI0038103063
MSGGMNAAAAPRLHDRTTELAAVASLSARVGAGASGVLLITGGPGTGRTALLHHAARAFSGTACLVTAPPGNRVPWSGVRGLLSALGPGPSAARRALRVARGPEGLASAVAGLAPERPLLLCVDDQHLWDAHSRAALVSALRAGGGLAGVGWVVSLARHHRPPDVPGAPLLRLGPLSRAGASGLLDDVCPGPLAPDVRERLLREAAGHPGVLAATARRLSPAQLAGDAPLPRPLTDACVLTDVYGGLLDALPAEWRRLLALVAVAGEATSGAEGTADTARPTVDAGAVLAAARATRTSPEALDGLVADGLLGGARHALRFEDPFLRRAVLAATPASWRRSARALFAPPLNDGAPSDGTVLDQAAGLRSRGPGGSGRGAVGAGAASDGRRGALTGVCGEAESAAAGPASGRGARRAVTPQTSPLLRALGHRADRLHAADEVRSLADVVRGRAELVRGLSELADGPVGDAHQALLLASALLRDAAPQEAADARFLAMEAAWAAGDPAACLVALAPDEPDGAGHGVGHGTGRDHGAEGEAVASHAAQGHPARPPHGDTARESNTAPGEAGPGHAAPDRTARHGETHGQDTPADDAAQDRPAPHGETHGHDTAGHHTPPDDAAQHRTVPHDGADRPDTARHHTAPHHATPGDAPQGHPAPHGDTARHHPAPTPGDGRRPPGAGAERDFLDGMRAALSARLHEARAPLARVVVCDGEADEPRRLLRAGSAALVLGDTAAAARIHTRALARVRAEGRTAMLPRVLEHLAYAELRAGRHDRAGTHAREGLRAAELTGQHNVAAHQHAVLALVASVAGDADSVGDHARQSLAVARRHGLAQAATLAEWALARAELGRGLAAQAAARLARLVRPGPGAGHFALRMLVVPCFVEAADATGRAAEARPVAEEFAVWAAYGLDPQAPAQLARCRALLAAAPEDAAHWYGEAMLRHDASGNDFERARTLLAYGKWLRRRRRPLEARVRLSDALVTFERAAAEVWAAQARAELRATGGAGGGASGPAGPEDLTPQQQRIAALAAEGATNREIAGRLSISPRTVDHHLRNVFARLGVRSRVELSGVLARAARSADGPAAVPRRPSRGRR